MQHRSDRVSRRKAVWGWMFFDWANQPWYTLIVTYVFGPYFVSRVAADPVHGQAVWGYAIAAGSVVVALTAPVLGAIADAVGPRKPWMLAFSALYVVGAAGLWGAAPGLADPTAILAFLVIALIGAEYTGVFTNAALPALGGRDEIGRISGSGWALGYWGGLASLAVVLGLMVPVPGSERTVIGLEPILGLDPGRGEGARAVGPLSALWHIVFVVPFFLWTPDAPRRPRGSNAVAKGLRELKHTLTALPSRGGFVAYLVSSMFYRDAVGGIYVFAGVYASGVLGWGMFEIGLFGAVSLVSGAAGAWIGGRADSRFGPKPVIVVTIVATMFFSCIAISTAPDEVLLIGVGTPEAPSSLPTIVFYVCGAAIAAAAGPLMAASRTMLVWQADEDRMTEAFGLYALAGKVTSFVAPFLIAVATKASGSQRVGITPILFLFLVGLVAMAWVDARGATAGQAAPGSLPARPSA